MKRSGQSGKIVLPTLNFGLSLELREAGDGPGALLPVRRSFLEEWKEFEFLGGNSSDVKGI